MNDLFTHLIHAMESTPLIAILAAVVWGVISIVLSPCHLASIPLIIGFINDQGEMRLTRAIGLSSLFAGGILLTITIIGTITALAGRMLGDLGSIGNYIVSVFFLLVGLHLMDAIPFKFAAATPTMRGKGLLAALLLGLIFGLALGPCTFAYMAPMLAITFKLAASSLLYGVVLLLAYGVGHCAVIVLAGTSAQQIQHYLNWNNRTGIATAMRRGCGVLVILAGLYLLASMA